MPEFIGHPHLAQKIDIKELFTKAASLWLPDSGFERCPNLDFEGRFEGFRPIDFINLHTLNVGDLIYFYGTNPSAFYTLKIDPENKIKAWRDRIPSTTGLISDLVNIVVWDQNTLDRHTETVLAYPGILFSKSSRRIQPRIAMPYFNYDENGIAQPADAWVDFIMRMWVKTA